MPRATNAPNSMTPLSERVLSTLGSMSMITNINVNAGVQRLAQEPTSRSVTQSINLARSKRLCVEHRRLVDDVAFGEDEDRHRVDFIRGERAGCREGHRAPHVVEQRRGVGS